MTLLLLIGSPGLASAQAPDAINATSSRPVTTLTVSGGMPEGSASLLQLAEVRRQLLSTTITLHRVAIQPTYVSVCSAAL